MSNNTKWLVLLLCLFPAPLWGGFDVTIGRSATSVVDTVNVVWSGIASKDSLIVFYDLNAVPDDDAVGVGLGRWDYSASLNTDVYDQMPEGSWVYFGLLGLSGGSWSIVGRDSAYIQDRSYGFPRVAGHWTGSGGHLGQIADRDTMSTFDFYGLNNDDVYDGDPTISNFAKLRDLNPDIHTYIHSHSQFTASPMSRWQQDYILEKFLNNISDSIPHTNVLKRVSGAQLTASINATQTTISISADIFPDGSALGSTKRPFGLLREVGTNNYEFVQVDTNSTTITVVRGRAGTSGLALATNDSIYYLDNGDNIIDKPTYGYNNLIISPSGGAPSGLEGGEWNARSHIQVIEQDWLDDPNTRVGTLGVMWDTYWADFNGTRGVTTDSALIKAAELFNAETDSGLVLACNTRYEGFTGIEDSIIPYMMLGEDHWTGSTRFGNSYKRDFMVFQLATVEAKNYRYGMRSDNFPAGTVTALSGGTAIQPWRQMTALLTMFSGVITLRKPFETSPVTDVKWLDELWVNSSGQAVLADTIDTDRHWLGWPTEPRQYIVIDTLTAGNMFTDLEDSLGGWVSADADTVTITRSTQAAHAGTYGLKAVVKVGHRPQTNMLPYKFFNNNASFSFPLTASLVDDTEYTIHFWARSGMTGAANSSRFAVVRIKTDADWIWLLIHIPQTWKEFYLPFHTLNDSLTANDLTTPEFEIGLLPMMLGDVNVDTLYFDQFSMEKGLGFIGWKQEFDNGAIVSNVRESAVTLDMTDMGLEDNVYSKIGAYSSAAWSDGTHNDTSAVATTIAIGAEDSYFLYGAATADVTDPDAVIGLTATDTTHNNIDLKWNVVDSTDVTGYMLRYTTTGTSPTDENDGTLVGTTASRTDTALSHSGLAETQQYDYTVLAFDAAGNYSTPNDSSKISVTTNSNPQITTVVISDRGGADYSGKTYDTYLHGSNTTTNYGSNATWGVKRSTDADSTANWPANHRYAYLMVNISGIFGSSTVVDSAKLNIHCTNYSDLSEYLMVYACVDSFADSTATWDSPFGDGTAWTANQGIGSKLDSVLVTTAGAKYNLSVGTEVQKAIGLNTTPKSYLNLVLRDGGRGADMNWFAAVDNATAGNRPQLTVWYHISAVASGSQTFIRTGGKAKMAVVKH